MAARFDELLHSALELTPVERSRLAAELIASLDGEPEAGAEAAWLAELDRRIGEVARGQTQLIDRDSVSSEIRETLRRG
jgi:putative addiction module component (TIGR02574 family)